MTIRKKSGYVRLIFIVLVCLFLTVVFFRVALTEPKQNPKAKESDCAACHGKNNVLPESHPDTKAMNRKGCMACHKEEKMSGSHAHQLSDITCDSCHGETKILKP